VNTLSNIIADVTVSRPTCKREQHYCNIVHYNVRGRVNQSVNQLLLAWRTQLQLVAALCTAQWSYTQSQIRSIFTICSLRLLMIDGLS